MKKRARKKYSSSQIALGGVFSALCLAIMCLTAVIPLSEYALPTLAGMMLVAVVIENGVGVAWMVYVSVSILSIFIVPQKEAALLFIAFFGYYPIIKNKLERIKSRLLEYTCKLGIFNVSILLAYFVVSQIFGFSQLIAEFKESGTIWLILFGCLANFTFIVYDFALTRYCALYVFRIRKALMRKK